MIPLAVLAYATPLFGFSLAPPDLAALELPVLAQLDAATDDAAPDAASDEASDPSDEGAAEASRDAEAEASPTQPDTAQLAAALGTRRDLATVHRALGIATWGSMLVTVVLGFLQYYNLYGFFAPLEQTPCVTGGAIFGQDQCWGEPWPHRIAAITTGALYTATFVLSIAMPDPLGADQGPGAENLRVHKALRWVHLGGMVAQVLLGLAVGQNWFGLERANDYGAMQALATVHQLIGLTTFGVLTAAGAIMIF